MALATLRLEAMLARTSLAEPLQQAKLLADYGMVCDWDGLSRLLSPETDE